MSLDEAITAAAGDLAPDHLDKLSGYLDAQAGPSGVALLAAEELVPLPVFRAACRRLWQAWKQSPAVPGSAIALALRTAGLAVANERTKVTIAPVVTGPSSWHVPIRQTATVISELIERAQQTLLLSSFAAYKVPTLVQGLNAAVARGVAVRMVLETSIADGGAIAHDPAQAFAQVPGIEILVWPAERRGPEGPGKASMHAKVVLADRDAAFVTSANLTGSALERNLEVGVLVIGGSLPGTLVDHFTELLASGDLVALPRN